MKAAPHAANQGARKPRVEGQPPSCLAPPAPTGGALRLSVAVSLSLSLCVSFWLAGLLSLSLSRSPALSLSCAHACVWLQDFVDKIKESPVADFEIGYKQGAPPILHLYDINGDEASDPISISQWKAEHIFEFLESKLGGAR